MNKSENNWYPVYHLQRKKYFEYLVTGPFAFNLVFTFPFPSVDRTLIEESLEILWQRHEILRTTYDYIDGEVLQYVHSSPSLTVENKYINLVENPLRDKLLSKLIEEMEILKSDFTTGPIIHIRLVGYNKESCNLLVGIHHIIADGHSVSMIQTELKYIYDNLKRGEVPTLMPPRYQIREYAEWVTTYINSSEGNSLRESYKMKILQSIYMETGLIEPGETTYSNNLSQELNKRFGGSKADWHDKIFGNLIQLYPYPTSTYITYLDDSFLLLLNKFSVKYSFSLSIVLIACFFLLFSCLRKTRFIRLCIPSSIIRSSKEWSSVFGWMTGEIIICQEIDPRQSISALMKNITVSILNFAKCSVFPFEQLLYELNFPVPVTSPVLINIIRNKNALIHNHESIHKHTGAANIEFECTIVECKNGIRFSTMYNSNAYTNKGIEDSFDRYFVLLKKIIKCHKNSTLEELFL